LVCGAIQCKKERFYDEGRIRVIRNRGVKTEISQYFVATIQQGVATSTIKKPTLGLTKIGFLSALWLNYLMISAITPEPTVLPPSRIAKRSPFSAAMGQIRVTVISTLSPGITISTPAGSSIVPVTSVVLK